MTATSALIAATLTAAAEALEAGSERTITNALRVALEHPDVQAAQRAQSHQDCMTEQNLIEWCFALTTAQRGNGRSLAEVVRAAIAALPAPVPTPIITADHIRRLHGAASRDVVLVATESGDDIELADLSARTPGRTYNVIWGSDSLLDAFPDALSNEDAEVFAAAANAELAR